MKLALCLSLILIGLLSSCSPSQKIVASWVNKDIKPKEKYNTIFVIALTGEVNNQFVVENKLDEFLTKRGKKVIKSYEKFPPSTFKGTGPTKEQIDKIITEYACDAVFVLTLLDVKSETHYQQGTTTYSPYGYGGYGYGGYYGYYNYYQPQVYTPGYYVTNKTYYIESAFYDTASDQLLWSIQSSAYAPSSFNSWFNQYNRMIFQRLHDEGLIKN